MSGEGGKANLGLSEGKHNGGDVDFLGVPAIGGVLGRVSGAGKASSGTRVCFDVGF